MVTDDFMLHNLSKLGKEFLEFICQFKLCHQIQFTMQDKKTHLLLCSQGNTNIPSFRAEGNPPTKIFFVLKSFKGAAPLGIVLLISTCILRVNEISNYIQKCFLCLLYLFLLYVFMKQDVLWANTEWDKDINQRQNRKVYQLSIDNMLILNHSVNNSGISKGNKAKASGLLSVAVLHYDSINYIPILPEMSFECTWKVTTKSSWFEGPRINLAGKGNLNIFHENYHDLLLELTENKCHKISTAPN